MDKIPPYKHKKHFIGTHSEEYCATTPETEPIQDEDEVNVLQEPKSKKKAKSRKNKSTAVTTTTTKAKKVKSKGKKKQKDKNKQQVELTENPYKDFYIPSHSFRGAFCFHCGAHDQSLMTRNSVKDWNDYLNAPRQSAEYNWAVGNLYFPSMCTCNCSVCGQRPKHCTCDRMFIPKICYETSIKNYLPKSKGEEVYTVTAKKYRDLEIMDGDLYDLATKIRIEDDPKRAVLLHDAFIYFWKRYLEHIHTRETLATLVSYVFIYSTICGRDKDAAPTRCVYGNAKLVTGNIQRGLCTRHKPQISQARVKKWTWIAQGREKFEQWKETHQRK